MGWYSALPRVRQHDTAAAHHDTASVHRQVADVAFGEKQASQEMFLDLCALVGHPTPVAYGNPEVFTFEKWVPGGFADAYLEDRFGWGVQG